MSVFFSMESTSGTKNVEETVKLLVFWDAMALMYYHCNDVLWNVHIVSFGFFVVIFWVFSVFVLFHPCLLGQVIDGVALKDMFEINQLQIKTGLNTLRPRQNGRHFPDDFFKCIFLNKNLRISIKFSLKFVPMGPINNIPALV